LSLSDETLDQNVSTLQQWIRDGWRYLADASLTSVERRKIRNGMREAEIALYAALKRIADQQRVRREAEKTVPAAVRLDFRIVPLDA
jgi:hypothetical protein